MSKCVELCKSKKVSCPNKNCPHWINCEEDLNCVFITVENHGPLSLREVGQRLGISHVAVQQIEKKALSKMKKVLFKNQIEKQRAFSKEEHYLNVKF